MQRFYFSFALSAFLFSSFLPFTMPETPATAGVLTIKINNIVIKSGLIRVAVYDSESAFLDVKKTAFSLTAAVGNDSSITLEIPDVPFGVYAVACFQDVNGNGKLDANWLGIPKEPYAFSANAQEIKWKAPKFKDARIRFSESAPSVSLQLLKWNER